MNVDPPALATAGAPLLAGSDDDGLSLPVEMIEQILLRLPPDRLPAVARANGILADMIFDPLFLKEYFQRYNITIHDAIVNALDRYQLLFARKLFETVDEADRGAIFEDMSNWAFVYMYKLFPPRSRSIMEQRLDEQEPMRTFGSAENAFLFRREWTALSVLSCDELLDEQTEAPGLASWCVPSVCVTLSTLGIALDRGPQSSLSAPGIPNLPLLALLTGIPELWKSLSDSLTYDGRSQIINMIVHSPDGILQLRYAPWFETFIDDLAKIETGNVYPFHAALCTLPLPYVKLILTAGGTRDPRIERPDILFRYALVVRHDIATWVVRRHVLSRGHKKPYDLWSAYALAQLYQLGRAFVAQDARFAHLRETVVSDVFARQIFNRTRQELVGAHHWHFYPILEMMPARNAPDLELSAQDSAQNVSEMVKHALSDPNRVALLLHLAEPVFYTHLANLGPDALATRDASPLAEATFLADVRVKLRPATLRWFVSTNWNNPMLIYTALAALERAKSSMSTTDADRHQDWEARLLLTWLSSPGVDTLLTRTQQQHAVSVLLTTIQTFPFARVNWRALAMLQNDMRYYVFRVIKSRPGFDPSVDNNSLVRAAYARGQLAFVEMWLEYDAVTQGLGQQELSSMRALLNSMAD